MATASMERLEMEDKQPAKSKLQQAIHEATAALAEQLNAGKSEALTNYLTAMARFHNYSFGNQMLIAHQKPQATQVAGFHKWLELHRYVKKGEKGIHILAPMVVKNRKEKDAESSENGPRLIGFKMVYVFDVSQTDGEALADYEKENVQGDAGELTAKLVAHIKSKGLEMFYDATIAPAYGLQYENTIKILPGQLPGEEFATLVHEYAHALLHRGERRQQTTKTMRETEAEAVAFIVATASGLEYGRAAADYIQMYDGHAATLAESLQHIQGAASEILQAIEN